MEELRTYWEVPAVAHFCSLFRAVFKLIDFDIEDFEDALIVDTESAAEGGRSSLIVDVLTALLRGCLGRRDVTLLNYNQFLHDLLVSRWVHVGFGPNPLGEDRERACFHILPLYAKVKVLHCLCEWRLERPDVEILTRDLNGDNLRVVPLGHDQRGATYWYFYGTRLYREEPVAQPKSPKKARGNESGGTSSRAGRGRRRKRRRNYDFSSKKTKTSPKKRRHNSTSSVDSAAGASNGDKRPRLEIKEETDADEDESTQSPVKQDQREDEGDDIGEESSSRCIQWKPKLEPDFTGEVASGSSSYPATPNSVYSTALKNNNLTAVSSTSQQEDSVPFGDLIKRIYSREEEDEDDDKSEKRSSTGNHAGPVKPEAAVPEETMDEIVGVSDFSELKRPYIPEGPPPWDQPDLRPCDSSLRGWSLVCSTLDDWNNLVDSFGKPSDKNEMALEEVLRRDFLPAMKDLFDQKERDRMTKLAELAPRRSSDRLEVKRLQKEREEKILAEREREEREKLVKVDEERQRRVEQEKREQRARLRELEREKRTLIKDRAREERSRRLELRQKRQQLIAEGKDVPEDLFNATGGLNYANDQELNEIDIEIELEHMYGQLEKLLDQLKEGEDAEPFVEPVKEEIAPDYYQVIETPMDFLKIEDKLFHREYKNKAEFVQDVNLVFLNCLRYNGLQSEYTKTAQRLERAFIKAWKRFFPPSDLEDFGEDARQEELNCISLLGALDKKIKEEVVMKQRAETEKKNQVALDKKELARERKREADRRRRRLKAEAKRAQQAEYQEQLASKSLSTLTNASSSSVEPPKRPPPAPFLVGGNRPTVQRPTGPPPARGPDGKFVSPVTTPSPVTPLQTRPPLRFVTSTPVGRGLTTYIPGITTTPRLPPPPSGLGKRVLPAMASSTLRQPTQLSINQQMAPITVHSSGASTKVIKVAEPAAASFTGYSNHVRVRPANPTVALAIQSTAPGPATQTVPSSLPANVHSENSLRPPGNSIVLNGANSTRLIRVPATDGQAATASAATRVIPAITAAPAAEGAAVTGSLSGETTVRTAGNVLLLNTSSPARIVRIVGQDGQTISASNRLVPAKTVVAVSSEGGSANSTPGSTNAGMAQQWTVHPVIFVRTDAL